MHIIDIFLLILVFVEEAPLAVVMDKLKRKPGDNQDLKKESQKKRKIAKESESDSDEAVVVKGEQDVKLRTKTIVTAKGNVTYFKLESRTHAYSLVESFKSLNDSQLKSIEELGFSSLLKLEMKHLPLFLSYWLVDNFDADRVALITGTGDTIFIEDVDVAIALGLPMGSIPVPVDPSYNTRNDASLCLWKKSVVSGNKRIHAADVVREMLADKDGGQFFKTCFTVLLISTLIESNTNGSVNFNYFYVAENVKNIKTFNWCGFLLDRLVETKKSWARNKNSIFTGSIPFLLGSEINIEHFVVFFGYFLFYFC